jgi:hypothetical protein
MTKAKACEHEGEKGYFCGHCGAKWKETIICPECGDIEPADRPECLTVVSRKKAAESKIFTKFEFKVHLCIWLIVSTCLACCILSMDERTTQETMVMPSFWMLCLVLSIFITNNACGWLTGLLFLTRTKINKRKR